MRKDVDHLPAIQQGELERIQGVLMEEFAEAIGRATTENRKNGKILKIILFGSYARNDWVDEPENGYQSDFDLLVVVNHDDLTDIAHYWYVAEDRILRDAAIARPVNIIVHSLDEVNQSLKRGEYFWVDIARDGIILYELPCHPLATPMPLTPADAYNMAGAYLDEWLTKTQDAIEIAEFCIEKRKLKDAAFTLHQATERAYICFLLMRTLYFPRSHNIKFLRSLAEDSEPRLIDAWPRERRIDRRRFQLLKRAYVEARYSTAYEITVEELNAILGSVRQLRDIVQQVSRERLDHLRSAAGL
ncbi:MULTISPECIES: HEPN domain-containing protein [Sphingomonas]|uniref:HEPN domain-containing protein n=1 Tax=Sphingomonas TaxID=13687 RepID=UPI000F7E074A|nr:MULTISPECIES: HEPN domain-containing protein [Sphingomonas]RSU21587.1 DNA-binding protein [Sphingomonas koreensis]RSU28292.1 DNA-binding protein [Sphingomonas koreensis]RSU29312.1 DNA-binding protein [Sphingomonas koreensis]RSU48847.1 DNA-binding protein [Sphingomonas koreensis]RSU89092.1 HEPN domain-containing protein [Sphingomonas koreensis]